MIPTIFLTFLLAATTPIASGVATACSSRATCTFTDSTVQDGITYTFFVEAVNTAGQSSTPSNSVQAVIPNDGQKHSVSLAWDPQPNPAAGDSYSIYRTSAPVGPLQITTQ